MPNTINRHEIDRARAEGRNKIYTIVSDWPRPMTPHGMQLRLKQLFGQRVGPVYQVVENFEPQKYHERHVDGDTLKTLMLTAFRAVEELDTICEMMHENRMSAQTCADYKTVQAFADTHRWSLCCAFYTYATDGKVSAEKPSDILHLESAMARSGQFPRDILNNLVLPIRSLTFPIMTPLGNA